jgi:hypothetical protein
MAAPAPRLTRVSAPHLLKAVRTCFDRIPDPRPRNCGISLADALMSGLAVFGLKYPSLLKFDEARQEEPMVRHNLRTLYGVERAPCDTQLRTILDPIDPQALHPAFQAVHRQLQRQKLWEPYVYVDGHYLLSIDGTGQFASGAIHCPECCRKDSTGGPQYYHQLLAAALVHPDRRTVLPLAPQPITRPDGASKNDCERNAAKRLLREVRADHPKLKLIVVEDSLAANGPHLKLLQELDLRFIITVKEGDHAALFEAVWERLGAGRCEEFEFTDEAGVLHGYRFTNDLALNRTHPELRVNFLEYWCIDGKQSRLFSWITDLELRAETVETVMRGGRARWKIENETFNTLKNQGYHLEHNYGHGQQHLASVFAVLTMLAFLIDQAQELGCRLFQAARARYRSRTSLWERLRARFLGFYVSDWQTLWQSIALGVAPTVLVPDTS